MSERLNASLCLPQGSLKSTTGVCCDVFLPSIQTSDHGIELIVIEQSPPPPPLSPAVGRSRLRRPLGELPPPAGDATPPPPAFTSPLLPPPGVVPPLGLRN